MSRRRGVRAEDYPRLADLVWKPGGVYDTWKAQRLPIRMAEFEHREEQAFTALGYRWRLRLSIHLWRRTPEAAVSLYAGRLLSASEVQRLHSAGFYEDMIAVFRQLGFPRPWIGIRGNASFAADVRDVSNIENLHRRFSQQDLGSVRQTPLRRGPRIPRRDWGARLLEWARDNRLSGWRVTMLEFQVKRFERAAGIRWGLRRDLILALSSSCTWLHVFAPHSLSTRALMAVRKTGLFKETADEMESLGHRGRWFPEYVKKRDRHTAEFWKPQRRGPLVSWNAFARLLDWRLDQP